jgi:hypothetical protein
MITLTKSLAALGSYVRPPNDINGKTKDVVDNTINSNVRAYDVLDIPQPEP